NPGQGHAARPPRPLPAARCDLSHARDGRDGRGDRLGGDRASLRPARPDGADPGRRTPPGGCRCHGPRAGSGPGPPPLTRTEQSGALPDSYLLPATRADLLRRLGRGEQARLAYERALELAPTDAERRYLSRRIRELSTS